MNPNAAQQPVHDLRKILRNISTAAAALILIAAACFLLVVSNGH